MFCSSSGIDRVEEEEEGELKGAYCTDRRKALSAKRENIYIWPFVLSAGLNLDSAGQ